MRKDGDFTLIYMPSISTKLIVQLLSNVIWNPPSSLLLNAFSIIYLFIILEYTKSI
jgi:hypothetical protein